MHAGQPIFGDCRWQYGVQITPTDTSKGISYSEAEFLGRHYWAKGPDGGIRIIRLVKNVQGSALSARQVLKYDTTAGRWGKDVVLATADTDFPAGVVEEGYAGGVGDDKWFRMVVYGKISLYLQTTADARCTIANGGVIVAAADDGKFWAQNSAASNAAVQNRLGFCLQATTDGVDNGLLIPCEINLTY